MKQFQHLGAYGLILKDNSILLINKVGGPYNGKLDLPGGTIEFGEKPEDTLKRELKEEVGIDIISYELFDGNSTTFNWVHKGEEEHGHHIGFFYLIKDYNGNISDNIDIDSINDDSKGAKFYDIDKLDKDNLSNIAFIEIEKIKKDL